ncbi:MULTISPECIES: zinc finger domain-containing protein [Pasteurellaceae]|nr:MULTISPECIES: Com family DNA-binding transcriptional regulator [Pasteurellaceae]QUC05853.1 Com family DNA-binding transcriptional regulator [Aggregatibacter sp. oral taxon 513]
MQNLKEIRCQCCNKLLAKVGTVKRLEIKCSRCKTINHIN